MLIDREQPCRNCGSLAGRQLPDGVECPRCGLIVPDRFTVARRSLQGGRHA